MCCLDSVIDLNKPFITIVTPSYNRANLLPRLYESLKDQTCKNFIWLVIDDGSTDNTNDVLRQIERETPPFGVQYVYKENGGKHTALNLATEKVETELFFIVDSDDRLTPDAIDIIKKDWTQTSEKRPTGLPTRSICGVSYLRGYSEGVIVGEKFSKDYLVSNFIDERYNRGVKGDKAEVQAVESWTSEAGKSKELNLTPGTYTFHEEAAPTGYLKVTDITFQVKTDGTVEVTNVGEKDSKGEDNKVVTNGSTVTVTDKDDDLPRKITFSKVSLGGTEIAGAQIKIYKGDKAEGTAVESWTSEAGKSKELSLAPGTYTFHEEAAPTGYLKVTDITFQVKHDGTVEVTNVGEKDAKGEENKVVTAGSKVTVTDKEVLQPMAVTLDLSGNVQRPFGGSFQLVATVTNLGENTVYQWFRTPNGGQPALLPAQQLSVLSIADLKASDAGHYYVEVSDGVRQPVRSASVYLDVIPEPKAEDNTGANTGNTHADPNDPHADSGRDYTFTNLKVYNFRQYANVMQPVNRTPPAIGLSWQIRLYGDLMDILKYPDVDVYMDAMDAAVDFFYTYKDSLFSMDNRARFLQYATDADLTKDDREALLEVFNVFASMGDPETNQRWSLFEIKDILQDTVAYARLVQYYDRKFQSMKSAKVQGNFLV